MLKIYHFSINSERFSCNYTKTIDIPKFLYSLISTKLQTSHKIILKYIIVRFFVILTNKLGLSKISCTTT